MIRLTTFVPLQKILSSFLNSLQDAVTPTDWLHGLLLNPPALQCTDGSFISVGAIQSLVASNGATPAIGVQGNTGAAAISVAQLVPGAALFALNTRYYIYAYVDGVGPNLLFEISTTAPNAARTIKGGDATRVYIGTFSTDNSAYVRRFYRHAGPGGRYTFIEPINLGSLTETGDYSAVDLTGLVPSWARVVHLSGSLTAGASYGTLQLRMTGQPSSARVVLAGSNITTYGTFSMPINASLATAFEQNVIDLLSVSSGQLFLEGYED